MVKGAEYMVAGLGRRFLVAGIMVPVLLLGGTACGLVGSDDAAETESEAGGDGGEGGGEGQGDDSASTPEEQALDIDVRHPNGTSMKLTKLSFEGNNIMVEFEAINSGLDEVELYDGDDSDALRLVDSDNNVYKFVEDADTENIKLASGDSLTGTMAFLGPLHGDPEELNFVTNVRDDDLETYDMSEESDSTSDPGFVLPLLGNGE